MVIHDCQRMTYIACQLCSCNPLFQTLHTSVVVHPPVMLMQIIPAKQVVAQNDNPFPD